MPEYKPICTLDIARSKRAVFGWFEWWCQTQRCQCFRPMVGRIVECANGDLTAAGLALATAREDGFSGFGLAVRASELIEEVGR